MDVTAPQVSRGDLLRMIRGGEDSYFELKVKLSNSEKIAQGIVALANTSGGALVFGVSDQLRIEGVENAETVRDELARICREEILPPLIPLVDCVSFDSGRQIVVLEVEGRRRPYRTKDGRFFLRFGAEKREATREELSAWLDEVRPLSYENIPLIECSEADIDDGLLWSFAGAFEDELLARNRSAYETAQFLKKDLMMGADYFESTVPTVAALLLFGKSARVPQVLPRSIVNAIRFSGDNVNSPIVEKTEISGNLLGLYENSLRFVRKYCDLWKERSEIPATAIAADSPVKARANYQADAVAEAIVNALTHRDLALKDISTRVHIFDSYIEVINPRRTNGFSPPAQRAIRYGITQRLNPQIATVFARPEYGAALPGASLPKLLQDSYKFSGKRCEILTSNDEFRLKMFGA